MQLFRIGIRVVVIAAVLSTFMIAQESPTYKVDVNVVNLLATVHDHDGRIVSDLTKDDFILEEDGKPQEIRYFTRQTDLSLIIGLLIDTSMSQRNLIEEERKASYMFLDQVLRPDRDLAFVIKFDIEAELLQDLTSSRSLLQGALNALEVPSVFGRPAKRQLRSNFQTWPGGQRRPGGRQGGPWPGGQPRMQGIGTVLLDSVYLASSEVLEQEQGRKAIILISDGVDNGSKMKESDATKAAHQADTIVYCIRYYDESAYGGLFGRGGVGPDQGSRGKAILNALARETGGRMFEVSRKLSLKEIYDRIQEELRNQYNLGYTPPSIGGTGFRRISLRTKDSKLEVVTRAGYYPHGR
jgi:VWFA-related protein